jgi:hypothetical protein
VGILLGYIGPCGATTLAQTALTNNTQPDRAVYDLASGLQSVPRHCKALRYKACLRDDIRRINRYGRVQDKADDAIEAALRVTVQ